MEKQVKIFLQGLIITAPIILTAYACVAFALWFERVTRVEALGPGLEGLGAVKLVFLFLHVSC